jgi:hypothetical protein
LGPIVMAPLPKVGGSPRPAAVPWPRPKGREGVTSVDHDILMSTLDLISRYVARAFDAGVDRRCPACSRGTWGWLWSGAAIATSSL